MGEVEGLGKVLDTQMRFAELRMGREEGSVASDVVNSTRKSLVDARHVIHAALRALNADVQLVESSRSWIRRAIVSPDMGSEHEKTVAAWRALDHVVSQEMYRRKIVMTEEEMASRTEPEHAEKDDADQTA